MVEAAVQTHVALAVCSAARAQRGVLAAERDGSTARHDGALRGFLASGAGKRPIPNPHDPSRFVKIVVRRRQAPRKLTVATLREAVARALTERFGEVASGAGEGNGSPLDARPATASLTLEAVQRLLAEPAGGGGGDDGGGGGVGASAERAELANHITALLNAIPPTFTETLKLEHFSGPSRGDDAEEGEGGGGRRRGAGKRRRRARSDDADSDGSDGEYVGGGGEEGMHFDE